MARLAFSRGWIALVLAALLLAAVVPIPSAEAAELRLKGVSNSRPQVQFKMWELMEQELPKRTGGQLKLDVTSLPELGLTGFELVRVMKAGLVDMADVLPTYVSGDVPLIEGVDLPGLFSLEEFDKSHKAHLAWHKVMKANEAKLGGVFIGSYAYAHQVLYSRKPIRDLADLKGMKVRVFGAAQTDFIKALGAEPVSLPVAEVYTALDRGTVDAAVTGTIAGFSLKWYEVTRYMVDLQIGPVMIGLVVSKKSWDRLSPDLRKALEEVAAEVTRKGWELARTSTTDGIEGNKTKGMQWIAFRPEWKAVIREAVQKSVLPGWAKRAGADGKTAFNEVLASFTGLTVP
ncbi:MAG: TRAP transporter substrate-binding protein DctP [Candidatus Rokubacteria bacterium]|nr:TRAP transporter substrate-binding protein DctP [Candidatus Rokubacteria bacterium]